MPLSINVGLSRKASKDYQSTGYSINIVAELDQSLLARPEELQAQIEALYQQAHKALDKQAGVPQEQQQGLHQGQQQVNRQGNGQQSRGGGYSSRNTTTSNGSSNGNGNGFGRNNGTNGATTARQTNGGGATESQKKAIFAISRRLNIDSALECQEVFGWDVNALTIKQASQFIDHLKSLVPSEGGSNGGGQ